MTADLRTLITPEHLLALLAAGLAPVLIEVSFDLADTAAGQRAWATGHLPGAHYLHLDDDLSGAKTGRNGRHPLPPRGDFAARLGRVGVTPQTPVVAFDRQGGVYAARLWWMLRWMGHADVAVLDGGHAAWQAAGGAVVADIPQPAGAAAYPERPSLVAQVDAQQVARQLGSARVLDARAPERFRGDVEPLDAVGGHIPGATNRHFRENLDAAGRRFKSASDLRADLEPLVGSTGAGGVIHQCGSGVTACHNLLAMEHAGFAGSVLYPGSWSEWSSDPARPVAVG